MDRPPRRPRRRSSAKTRDRLGALVILMLVANAYFAMAAVYPEYSFDPEYDDHGGLAMLMATMMLALWLIFYISRIQRGESAM